MTSKPHPAPSPAPQVEDFVAGLVREHSRAMMAYALRLTGDRHSAEDIVQEAFVRAWRHHAALDEQRGSVRGWLLTVVRNLVIDRVRARDARPAEVADVTDVAFAGAASVPDHADRLATAVTVHQALDRLSPEHRSVLVEMYVQGRTASETAVALGLPLGTVKSRSYYALRQLRGWFEPATASSG